MVAFFFHSSLPTFAFAKRLQICYNLIVLERQKLIQEVNLICVTTFGRFSAISSASAAKIYKLNVLRRIRMCRSALLYIINSDFALPNNRIIPTHIHTSGIMKTTFSHHSKVKLFLLNSIRPSSRIFESSFDMALLSTERKSASCWRLKGIEKLEAFCLFASSDR